MSSPRVPWVIVGLPPHVPQPARRGSDSDRCVLPPRYSRPTSCPDGSLANEATSSLRRTYYVTALLSASAWVCVGGRGRAGLPIHHLNQTLRRPGGHGRGRGDGRALPVHAAAQVLWRATAVAPSVTGARRTD